MGEPKKTPWKCKRCKHRFHIKEYRNSWWYSLMPPYYCPRCGYEVKMEEFKSLDEEYAAELRMRDE